MRRSVDGFNLIELLIVLAVIGIIAMVAWPAYTDHLRKGRRSDAQSVLLEAAQAMERFYTEHHRYHQSGDGAAMELPAALRTVPRGSSGDASYYRIVVSPLTASSYTLTAVPVGRMSGDACGGFVLNHLGQKSNGDATISGCWTLR